MSEMQLCPKTICEMNQKGANRSQIVGVQSYPFQTRNSRRFCNGPFLGWESLLELCCLNFSAKKSPAAKLAYKGWAESPAFRFTRKYLLIFSWKMSVKFY